MLCLSILIVSGSISTDTTGHLSAMAMVSPPIPAPTSRACLTSPSLCRIFHVRYSATSLLDAIASVGRVNIILDARGNLSLPLVLKWTVSMICSISSSVIPCVCRYLRRLSTSLILAVSAMRRSWLSLFKLMYVCGVEVISVWVVSVNQ